MAAVARFFSEDRLRRSRAYGGASLARSSREHEAPNARAADAATSTPKKPSRTFVELSSHLACRAERERPRVIDHECLSFILREPGTARDPYGSRRIPRREQRSNARAASAAGLRPVSSYIPIRQARRNESARLGPWPSVSAMRAAALLHPETYQVVPSRPEAGWNSRVGFLPGGRRSHTRASRAALPSSASSPLSTARRAGSAGTRSLPQAWPAQSGRASWMCFRDAVQ